MSSKNENIIDAALQEALGGNTPPDLISSTMAKAQAEGLVDQATPSAEPAGLVRPGPNWRAWGTGLAAAAAVVVVALVAIPLTTANKRSAEPVVAINHRTDSSTLNRETIDELNRRLANSGITELNTSPPSPPSEGNDIPYITNPMEPPPPPPPNPSPARGLGGSTFSGSQKRKDYTGSTDGSRTHPVIKARASGTNPFVDTEDDALPPFALEHDTGSYAVARAYFNRGQLPPSEVIRPEEFINYFGYDYQQPINQPFGITMDGAPSLYGQNLKNSYILRVGVQAQKVYAQDRKPAVLTFVIDISGSMSGESRLGLVKKALITLVGELRSDDVVGIATYGSNGAVYMQHKSAANADAIINTINALGTEGATNAEEGLVVGYSMAEQAFNENAINRVILCSDGVANLGSSTPEAILKNVIEKRRKGITLSAIGFGMDNYNDNMMEQLGDKGDGHYAYVDSIEEANRIFKDNLTGTLQVAGRDVKVQVEFNPEAVKSYRLIGYVNRDVAGKDFRNDEVDGGEIGAGQAATAI
ncbi:MAG: von Willebrand factor type A domain-containing protein [Planctomycetes bacterium]|nr:von Willebrand factor type A domain-containing protein [Planctomycetota bacterium]